MSTEMERQEASAVGNRVERANSRATITPAVDIAETTEALVLTADMPGVDDKGVEITLEQDVLTIEGHMPSEALTDYTLGLREYEQGDFRRVFTLATEIDRERIEARVTNGVLRLVLPKAAPAKAKKINVVVGA